MSATHCRHCKTVELSSHDCEHPGLCCDCADLSWFPDYLDILNEERAEKGRPPMPAWSWEEEKEITK